jgi:hypothetical protein
MENGMENEKIKKVNPDDNEVLDTSGGEMPDPLKKMTEKAADAAKAFEQKVNPKMDPKVNRDAGQDADQNDEQKKAG